MKDLHEFAVAARDQCQNNVKPLVGQFWFGCVAAYDSIIHKLNDYNKHRF